MNAFGTLPIALLLTLSGSALAGPTPDQPGTNINNQLEKVFGCWGDEHGDLEGGVFYLPMDQDARQIIDAMNQANRGAVDNRVDMVIVGDGYTANEQALFHQNATFIENSFFEFEPFKSYAPYFRFTQVEVVSPESGVDNDPTEGINRDTALDMGYWCGGTERALCVDIAKAYTAAAAAQDIDQVIAIANSDKYGGVGYPGSNIGTAAGRNSAAAQIAIHEMGHSLGDLADEYTYGGPTTYTGGELGPVDVSIFDRIAQLDLHRKWWRWMDASTIDFDNPIDTYEGGNYSVFGVYRPSPNSMMRNLNRPFNLVSAEQILKKIYREVNPIDDGTPANSVVSANDTLWITPMQPLNHDLQVVWFVDDQIIPGAIQHNTLDLSTLNLGHEAHTIMVEVTDTTAWVRNEGIRNARLREARIYTVEACSPRADLSGDGILDFFDVSTFLDAYANHLPEADFNGDGIYDFFDVSTFIQAFIANECQ